MKIFKTIHTAYGLFIFFLIFLILLPLLFIPMIFPQQFRLTGLFNRWWAKLMFMGCFLPYKVECMSKLEPDKQYIFCPNHFSYLDIPTMGLNPVNTIFVGKNDMEKIPLFGYMYKKLHITVNRKSLRSRSQTMLEARKAIAVGKSLVIYPEGGITTPHPPQMSRFKDGAFRVAIEKQIAVVPVTIPRNWIILPDHYPLLLNAGKVEVIFHNPIETKGMDLSHTKELKEKVFKIIEHELSKHGNNQRNSQ